MADVFQNENVAVGLSPGNSWQVGISDNDAGTVPEAGLTLPWCVDPKATWLEYNCTIEAHLDSGIVVHRSLPQTADAFDSLGTMDVTGQALAKEAKTGVNLRSNGKFEDVTQRMAHSVYRFCLKGWALRAGYQVPIPKLKTVGGVTAIPDDQTPQKASNTLVANYSGVPVWLGRWELWYTVAVPPTKAQDPPANLAQLIGPKDKPEIKMPISGPDSQALPANPVRPGTPARPATAT